MQGEVLPGFGPGSEHEERSVYALEAKLSGKQDPTNICTLAMIKGRYKLIKYLGYEDELADELFDLANDPDEMENLAFEKKRLTEEIGAELQNRLDKDLGRKWER